MLPGYHLSRHWPSFFASPPEAQNVLAGSEEILSEIVDQLLTRSGKRTAIWGPPGVGKTALVLAISEHPRIRSYFRDGVLWARPVPYLSNSLILGAWADYFNSDITRLAGVEQRASAVAGLLHKRRVLIVLDGVTDAGSAAALACGGPHSATILTTQDSSLAQEFCNSRGIWQIKGFTREQAIQLLSLECPEIDWSLQLSAIPGSDDSRFLPLSLTLVAGALTDQPGYPVGDLVKTISVKDMLSGESSQDHSRRNSGESKLLRIVEWSLDSLPQPARDAFRDLLAFAPEPDCFDRPAAAQVAGASAELLHLLSDRCLIRLDHDNISVPAALSTLFRFSQPHQAQEKHCHYYREQLTGFSNDPEEVKRRYGQSVWVCRSHAAEAFRKEIVNALAAYQEELGLWEDYRACGELALQACQAHYLCQEEGYLCNNLGRASHMLGEPQIALSYYQLADSLLDKDGDRDERASVMNNIASIYIQNGESQAALRELSRAIALLEGEPRSIVQAYLFNNLGKIYDDLNLPVQACDQYKKALQVLEEVNDAELELTVRFNLSLAFLALGLREQALENLRQAVEIEQRSHHPNYENDLRYLRRLQKEKHVSAVFRWLRNKLSS